jgi:hypothetical protein
MCECDSGRHADDRLVSINLAMDVGARPPCSRGSCQQPFQQTSYRRCEATNNDADREDRTKLPDGPPKNVEFDAAELHGNTSEFGWLGAPLRLGDPTRSRGRDAVPGTDSLASR